MARKRNPHTGFAVLQPSWSHATGLCRLLTLTLMSVPSPPPGAAPLSHNIQIRQDMVLSDHCWSLNHDVKPTGTRQLCCCYALSSGL